MRRFILFLTFILLVSIEGFSQTITFATVGVQDMSGISVEVEQLVPGAVGYNINSVTYSYESTAGTSVSVGDDQTVTGRPIGFTFNYWGTNYTTVNICSNGWISFTNTGGNIVGYGTNSTVPAGIHGVALDLYPSGGYFIRYQTLGTAPNRKFVVSYHMDYYGCRGNWTDFQIVLYETTNNIQINVATHPTCGNALQGLSNQSNNQWAITPGRNGQNWTGTTNSSMLFTPYSTSATWTSRGTQITNSAGSVTFSNPNNYQYKVHVDVTGMSSVVSQNEMNYMMYMKMFPNEMSSWDFHTCDWDGDTAITITDIVESYMSYTNGDPVAEHAVYSQSEKDDIEVNATTFGYHTKYPRSPIRTFENLNRFYIVSLGKHRRVISNLYKIN